MLRQRSIGEKKQQVRAHKAEPLKLVERHEKLLQKMEKVEKNCEVNNEQIEEIYRRVFAGHFEGIPGPISKLVRVFTSSTFTDTTMERNALMEDVYPLLKEYCRETHGLDFQVVVV